VVAPRVKEASGGEEESGSGAVAEVKNSEIKDLPDRRRGPRRGGRGKAGGLRGKLDNIQKKEEERKGKYRMLWKGTRTDQTEGWKSSRKSRRCGEKKGDRDERTTSRGKTGRHT